MKKDIIIGNKTVPMSASAFTPFAFKKEFNDDLIAGMQKLNKKDGTMDAMFVAQVAYIMAKEADHNIAPIEEWLSGFEMFDIYEAFPEIIKLWALNEQTHSKPVKK